MTDGVRLRVDSRDVEVALGRILDSLEQPIALFRQIGAKLESNIEARFDTETDPDGKKWKPWSPQYARWRAAQRRGQGRILSLTGRMRDSLSYSAAGNRVEIGFGVPYAEFHELGRGVPPRRMLSGAGGRLGAEDERDVLAIIASWASKLAI